MSSRNDDQKDNSRSKQIAELLESGTLRRAAILLNGLRVSDAAHLLESSPPPSRSVLWSLFEDHRRPEVLALLGDDLQGQFASSLDTNELAALSTEFETDDLVDILQQLPEKVTREVLQAMSLQDRERVDRILRFPKTPPAA